MPWDLVRLLFDPTAPLPASWPVGALGAFLAFYLPVAAGIPLGVLLGVRSGLSFVEISALYLASDVAAAVTCEPFLVLLDRTIGRRPLFVRIVGRLAQRTADTGMRAGGLRGGFGVAMLGFTFIPLAARLAGSLAGYRVVTAWALGILGDMAYFFFAAASTLWLSSVFGNDVRATLLAVFVVTFVLPGFIGRLRRPRASLGPAPKRP